MFPLGTGAMVVILNAHWVTRTVFTDIISIRQSTEKKYPIILTRIMKASLLVLFSLKPEETS